MPMQPEIETVLPGPFALGEGPCWHGGENALYFVDALRPAIHRWHPAEGLATWAMPAIVGSFAIRRSGGLIASLQTGFAREAGQRPQ
jgi:L-arabinonolactonase